jgi:hypothetical protein
VSNQGPDCARGGALSSYRQETARYVLQVFAFCSVSAGIHPTELLPYPAQGVVPPHITASSRAIVRRVHSVGMYSAPVGFDQPIRSLN